MELRRALLLFAIVLGVAAIVTSVSRPERGQRDSGSAAPDASDPSTAPESPGDPAVAISFDTRAPATRELEAGRHATVTVKVPAPGEVYLEGLGLSSAAEPLTPAHFDVLASRQGRHAVRFQPAQGGMARTVGTLRVLPAPE